jgi:NTP pyrophosphatase (non-canonical NTP hydrolase)
MINYDMIAKTLMHKNGGDAALWQTIVLAEETGEAIKQFRRWQGQARTDSKKEDFAQELADVIITANVLASLCMIDLNEEVALKLAAIEDRGGL